MKVDCKRYLLWIVYIKNTKGLGFNLWLIQTDDMYGDWYVLKNKNNGIYATQYEPKQEPFAFEIDELDEALKGINAFSLYSSEVEPFDKQKLMGLVAQLIN